MAWPQKFKADLTLGRQAPQFIVRGVKVAESPGPAWEIQGPAQEANGRAALVQGVFVRGSRVSTDGWASTVGSIEVRLVGDVSGLLTRINRGQIVEVLAGFSGYSDSDYATIALGQVFDFGRSSDALEYTLLLRDIWAALSSRISTTADELSLFAGLPSAATVLADYTASDGVIDVDNGTEFPKETGGQGAFSVAGNSTLFYVTWSSSVPVAGGRRYTIVSADALGTADEDADAGNAVQALAYIKDEPVDVIRKILVSTGAGTNGAFDTLPKTWGYGIPDRFIDHEDIRNTREFTRTASTDRDWEAWSSSARSNGLSWIFGTVFRNGGYFPAVHQGRMSVRAAVDVYKTSSDLAANFARNDRPFIQDRFMSVAPLLAWDAWSPDRPVEYFRVRVTANASTQSATEPVGALPAEDTLEIDVSSWVHNNVAQHIGSIRARMDDWGHRVPERFEVAFADMVLAGHTIGSVPLLDSRILHGRIPETSGGFDNVPVFVTQVSIDWQRRTMTLAFEVYSDNASDF